MVRAPPCHGGGRGFESHPGRLCRNTHDKKEIFLYKSHGILAQLGEHLPYKQRVTGSSPVGSTQSYLCKCRRGGTGRRTGLKILRDLYSRTGSIPVAGIENLMDNYFVVGIRLSEMKVLF